MMLGPRAKVQLDENASAKYNQVQVKNLTVPSKEATTNRAALSDIQNRELNCHIAAKEFKEVKAHVDTPWKKLPTDAQNSNVIAVKTTTIAAPFFQSLRFQSMRQISLSNIQRRAVAKVPNVEVNMVKKEPTVTVGIKKIEIEIKPQPKTISLSSQRFADVQDIDAADQDNLILVPDYVNDIYNYLYELEDQQPIHVDHLANQAEVSSQMRAILIDWINQVHLQWQMLPETFQMTVSIMDRYLQVVKTTKRQHFQLLGVTALYIAAKYEELSTPPISKLVFICDFSYTAREIRLMEQQILKAIDHNLSRPLPIHFLRRYSKAACAEDAHHVMSKYFLELSAMDYDLASYKPSEIAAASLFLTLHLLNGNALAGTGFNDNHWTPTLVYYSRYTPQHLRPITKQIAKLVREAPLANLTSIYSKYQATKFQKMALRSELSSPLLDSIVSTVH